MVLETLGDGSEGTIDLEARQRIPLEAQVLTQTEPEADGEVLDSTRPSEAAPPESQAPMSMSEAILGEYDYQRPRRGEMREGIVIAVDPSEVIVDIGAKRECIVSASDINKLGDEVGEIHEGDTISVCIVKTETQDGHLIGSLYLARLEKDWARAEKLEQSGDIVEVEVTGQNRGGVLVPFGRLRGFVPASHLSESRASRDGEGSSLSRWVGQTIPLKVIEVNRRRNRLILSYRAARREWRSQQKRQLLTELTEGDVRRGRVSSLASFGAFVDLGGADGLIHVSELAWYRVEHPSDILQVGDEIDVYVLRVDTERGRIGLSLKRLQPDPWDLVDDNYFPGQNVEGKIVKLVDFGAFVELEKGVEGLIHITELADPTPARAEEVVLPGEVHLLRVLRVESQSRRIGLSMKAVTPSELDFWEASRAAQAEEESADETAEPEAVQADETPAGEIAEPEAVQVEEASTGEVTEPQTAEDDAGVEDA